MVFRTTDSGTPARFSQEVVLWRRPWKVFFSNTETYSKQNARKVQAVLQARKFVGKAGAS